MGQVDEDALADAVARKVEARIATLLSATTQTAAGGRERQGGGGGGATSAYLDAPSSPGPFGTGGGVAPAGEGSASQRVVDDDAWATVLHGDEGVRAMMVELRTQAQKEEARIQLRRIAAPKSGAKSWQAAAASACERTSRRSAAGALGDMGETLKRSVTRGSAVALSEVARGHVCPVLHPNGRLRSAWNVVIVALLLFVSVAVPLEIGCASFG